MKKNKGGASPPTTLAEAVTQAEAGTAAEGGEGTESAESAEPEAAEPVAEAEAVEPIPPAPGDDAESVFERRIERLNGIVADAEFESGTALGDLTDLLLDLFKHRPKLWSAMDSNEQRDTIRAVEAVARKALEKVVMVVAQEDFETIEGTLLGQFNVKGEVVEAKIKVEHIDSSELLSIYKLAGHRVVVISADAKAFANKRREPEVMADQHALKFEGNVATSEPKPKPPADDSDLAGEASSAEVEEVPGDGLFGVFDEDRAEWLADETGGDDGWTPDPDCAGKWPHARATELAKEFDDPEGKATPLAVRLLSETPEEEAEREAEEAEDEQEGED